MNGEDMKMYHVMNEFVNVVMSQIESEYHFLLVCPLYTELRRTFFKPYFCHWPNVNKFDQLMLSNSKQVTLGIAKFIFSAQELRKSALNP